MGGWREIGGWGWTDRQTQAIERRRKKIGCCPFPVWLWCKSLDLGVVMGHSSTLSTGILCQSVVVHLLPKKYE